MEPLSSFKIQVARPPPVLLLLRRRPAPPPELRLGAALGAARAPAATAAMNASRCSGSRKAWGVKS